MPTVVTTVGDMHMHVIQTSNCGSPGQGLADAKRVIRNEMTFLTSVYTLQCMQICDGSALIIMLHAYALASMKRNAAHA